ncbi:hypothetical protein [Microscilla marina]|uniref:Uncharacterized protein n=1 Tax=Microscilla marina ATCC 23134 TaxID=313606 RepID=A1ZYS4_MICM2|nr:hypothetical protein [Microscilla marina]EAY24498.1 hypothetical protein M23134_06485 [Microscilla marina ATCC 23134]
MMNDDVDTSLMLRIVTNVLDNDWETAWLKLTTDPGDARLVLPKPIKLRSIHFAVNDAYEAVEKHKQEAVNIAYWDEREAYLIQALGKPVSVAVKEELQAELDGIIEKKRDLLHRNLASPLGPPNLVQQYGSVARCLVDVLKINDPESVIENALIHDIGQLFKQRIANTIRPE